MAAFVLGTHVAKTIGQGMIDLSVVTREVILSGLVGAIAWNLLTWYYGLPVSSSHALIGGYAMGSRITRLQPFGGFCAETSGAITIVGATLGGIPVSTTHTITGAIVGVGATRRLSAVKWGVAGRIVWAWVLTIPLSAGISAACYQGYEVLSRLR